MDSIWMPWGEGRNSEVQDSTRVYKADEVDADKAKDTERIRELEGIERNLRETSKITIDNMDNRIKELEGEIKTMVEIIENLKREKQERELIIEKMKHIATEALKEGEDETI